MRRKLFKGNIHFWLSDPSRRELGREREKKPQREKHTHKGGGVRERERMPNAICQPCSLSASLSSGSLSIPSDAADYTLQEERSVKTHPNLTASDLGHRQQNTNNYGKPRARPWEKEETCLPLATRSFGGIALLTYGPKFKVKGSTSLFSHPLIHPLTPSTPGVPSRSVMKLSGVRRHDTRSLDVFAKRSLLSQLTTSSLSCQHPEESGRSLAKAKQKKWSDRGGGKWRIVYPGGEEPLWPSSIPKLLAAGIDQNERKKSRARVRIGAAIHTP